ncbi:hypothetical protein [Corynebacterium flavescens]|uniref:Uncharacterized protein n=1 Tax=Corynebacterium flavescens TaxID=28028 RepID=A0AB73B8N6_CORFL|nr:hypothetical protein [Corynebacterium flavescens]MDN6100673.1 hypothetical protein [Corynebacterium flavescens]MDN6227558.1 hypothetical protein [Corynebacterium flavescens]MDN6431601.1 hypothetical protein [Corynebacterium flavescens]MDN6532216.1 hypothetical protein [Corynebacterium flavescens]MDN6601013.1 hypothetical protein [Corynebacterium flavescens]
MCRAVNCKSCGKTTWAGCGNHIDSVKATVPAEQWCTCTRDDAAQSGGFKGLFGRIFG